jgi:hypothetical protein
MICYLFQNWEDSDRIRYEISYEMGSMECPVLWSAGGWREGVPALTAQSRMPSAVGETLALPSPGSRL